MKTLVFNAGEQIKLNVKISSDANVGSNVSLNDTVIKKSITNNFNVNLGLIDDIDGQTLSVVSNFFVAGGNIDAIMQSTHVVNNIRSDSKNYTIESKKVKISSILFMAYLIVKLKTS